MVEYGGSASEPAAISVDAGSGDELWRLAAEGRLLGVLAATTLPDGSSGTLLIELRDEDAEDGRPVDYVMLDASGTEMWRVPALAQTYVTAAWAVDDLVIVLDDAHPLALDLATGEQRWASEVFVAEDRAVVLDVDGAATLLVTEGQDITEDGSTTRFFTTEVDIATGEVSEFDVPLRSALLADGYLMLGHRADVDRGPARIGDPRHSGRRDRSGRRSAILNSASPCARGIAVPTAPASRQVAPVTSNTAVNPQPLRRLHLAQYFRRARRACFTRDRAGSARHHRALPHPDGDAPGHHVRSRRARRGRTGSGKTLAFALPMVARLADGRRATSKTPRALVLAPTRELASQIAETLAPLAAAAGLRHTVIFGGVGQNPQVKALAAGVDIVIACPGRLEDLMGQGALRLDQIEITVLDEADHMADLGFLPGVKRILDKTPRGGQRMLFSATLDNGVDVLVKRYLSDPVTHSVDPASSPVAAMTHHVFTVSGKDEKRDVVETLASGTSRRLLFTRTKHQAKRLAKQLTTAGIPAVDLHGNLSQNARQRNLEAFSSGTVRVLVATDIAARGIHVDDVELVVHVDPPAEHKAYLHRSGRTARAGSGGDVVTIVMPEERGDFRSMARAAKITAAPEQPTAERLASLVGEVAAKVTPPPAGVSSPANRNEPASRGPRPSGSSDGRPGRSRGRRSGQGSGGGASQGAGGGRRSSGGQGSGASRSQGGSNAGRTRQGASSGGSGRSSGSSVAWSSSTTGGSSGSYGGGSGGYGGGSGSGSSQRRGPRRATRDSGSPRG